MKIRFTSHKHTASRSTLPKLPLLISVPHGGYTVPAEIRPFTSLTPYDIFPDSDPGTHDIYNFRNEVLYYHSSNIARAIVDLNRKDDDIAPQNPDGVIKSCTLMGIEVFRNDPNQQIIDHLLDKYYYPYQIQITKNMADPALVCGLDCHTMLEYPPGQPPSYLNKRPFICLSNNGDENGESCGTATTCSPGLIRLLADCLRSVFPDQADNIILNSPFKGGHISCYHSESMPWIQIELNRNAYLQPQWFNPATLHIEQQRLDFLREKFLQALIFFSDQADSGQYSRNYTDLFLPDTHTDNSISYLIRP